MASVDEIHDRLAKAQDVLVDLRQMINRLAGNSTADDQRRRSSSGSSVNNNYNTPANNLPDNGNDLFFYLDKEAADDLVNDITDTLRDAQDDLDLLREDALDLGVIAAETASHTAADNSEEPDAHAISGVNRTLRPFGTSLRSSSAHSGGSGGMRSSFTDDDTNSVDGVRLQRGVARLGEGLADARKAFRAAQLAAHRNREAAQREQHRQVLASYIEEESEEESEGEGTSPADDGDRRPRPHSRTRPPPPLVSKHTSPTTSAAADVTAALRQTHARIAGEVARSDFAAQTLAESSRALAELGDKYGGGGSTGAGGGGDIGTSLKSARTLVKGLLAAHKSDTWYLQTALYMVVATIGWLFFRRLLYGPLWLLVWWPLRTVFGTAAWVGRAGAGGKHASVSSISVGESPITSIVTSIVTTSVAAEVYATEAASAAPSDSLVEEVGRIVDGSAAAAGAAPTGEVGSASEEAVQPNPKKRMWEEPVEAAKHEEQLRKEREEKEKAEQEGKGKGKEPAEGERKKDEL